MPPKPNTIEEALNVMERLNAPDPEKWQALAIALREMALSEGVDTEREIGVKFDTENDPPMWFIFMAIFILGCGAAGVVAALGKICGFF
jgi:hypothetical protein